MTPTGAFGPWHALDIKPWLPRPLTLKLHLTRSSELLGCYALCMLRGVRADGDPNPPLARCCLRCLNRALAAALTAINTSPGPSSCPRTAS